ncbi:methyltransferase domain-containing protein [Paenibacillus aestuarii]|uniref:Methyltransferase domain-containing protein n=1 Tax=Paenibacillus aestuarii TaxID=516965 RepID=A0ABW0KG66_9BACL|nr:methyltransferase domain-containing protein [Paenibacillus aestuarii]
MEKKTVYEQAGVAMTSRSFAEYERMFMLNADELQGKRVLDVAGGASSFTADARRQGILAEAADPLYAMAPATIAEHGRQEVEVVAAKLDKLRDVYDWSYYGSVEAHRAGREESLRRFVEDFAEQNVSGQSSNSVNSLDSRYHIAQLPELPFADQTFDLVLCSHFLFLYEEQFDYAFHQAAVRELLRVCKAGGEVRIYPLLSFRTEEYAKLKLLLDDLHKLGFVPNKRKANLPFLPNSEYFVNISKPSCTDFQNLEK